jgi:orotidine-5'-phosphate decarboxylase
MRHFMNLLNAQFKAGKNLCVGIDPDPESKNFPVNLHWLPYHEAVEQLSTRIVDATAKVAAAYKINSAFFEACGENGLWLLHRIVEYCHTVAPDAPVIVDAKRADIGKTNEMYARSIFDHIGADATTLHPYLGWKAMKPFLDKSDKGLFVLVHTSNDGADEFQHLVLENGPQLYVQVAINVRKLWNYNTNCGLVAGATYPEQLGEIRQHAGDMPLLIPGIGTQGGDLENSVKYGMAGDKANFLINVSSGLITPDENYAQLIKEKAEYYHLQIQQAVAKARQ